MSIITITDLQKTVDDFKLMSDKTFVGRLRVGILNRLAVTSKREVVRSLKSGAVFDLPIKPHISSSVLVKQADYTDLNPETFVVLKGKDPITALGGRFAMFKGAGDYLKPHVEEINVRKRPFKWLEKEVKSVLKFYDYAVPALRDPPKFTKARLKFLARDLLKPRKIRPVKMWKRRVKQPKSSSPKYFVLTKPKGRLIPGIWQLYESSGVKTIKLVYSSHKKVTYDKKPFLFYKDIRDNVDMNFNRYLESAFNDALKRQADVEFRQD